MKSVSTNPRNPIKTSINKYAQLIDLRGDNPFILPHSPI